MQDFEKHLVKTVAKLAPWLAPFPSAFFVARSAMAHLALPWWVAVVVAAIIETLGLSTVHTALWAYAWNQDKRRTDPSAPVALAVALGCVYLVATIGLVVVLEVVPWLATYAPAIFPALAVVGAVNLAMIAQQERREAAVDDQKQEAREQRRARRLSRKASKNTVQEPSGTPSNNTAQASLVGTQKHVQNGVLHAQQVSNLDAVNVSRQERKAALLDALVDVYTDDPKAGPSDISRQLGISRSTVYNYLDELESLGRVRKNGHGVEVLEL